MSSKGSPARVAILLCTFNGQKFLTEQLDSIQRQTHKQWKVFASDDGSADGTPQVLAQYVRNWGADRLDVRIGPGKGFVANFLSLACDTAIKADYYGFCDQDDLWDADKLERALAWLDTAPRGMPALYCARTRLIAEDGGDIGFSPFFGKPLTFRNALVQSIAGGNTMVFNEAARQLLVAAGADVDVITHDWWLYMLVTGCGGTVHYDFEPSVSYRQHGRNLVGSNASWMASYSRAKRLLAGRFSSMNERNIIALERVRQKLTADSQDVLMLFSRARNSAPIPRVVGIVKSGVYHHTFLGTLGLIAATLFKKL